MFVTLDGTHRFPTWLPETHVRFAFEEYGFEQLVGAIKLRVQEAGGSLSPPDALSEAKRVQREAEFIKDRDWLMRDRAWIEKTVHSALRQTMQQLYGLAEAAKCEHNLNVECAVHDMTCVLRSGFVSMGMSWKQPIYNFVGRDAHSDCFVWVKEFSGFVKLPQERGFYIHEPRLLTERRFRVDLALDRTLVWVEESREGTHFPHATG